MLDVLKNVPVMIAIMMVGNMFKNKKVQKFVDKPPYKQFIVRMKDGNTYFVPAYTVSEAKARVVKYFPSQYCIDDKPNFVDSDLCKALTYEQIKQGI